MSIKNVFQTISITAVISSISFISLAFFIKALGVIYGSWFSAHAKVILLVSGSIIILSILAGSVSLGVLLNKTKRIFN